MALKKLIAKETYDTLSDDLKKEYKLGDDGKYHLDLEKDESFEALKAEKAAEKQRREEAEKKLREREEAEAAAAEELRLAKEKEAKASGDVAALEASWKEKYDNDVTAAKRKADESILALKAVFVNKVAHEMADAISTVPDLLFDKIKSRLDLEIHEGEPITRVLSADGKPSALSLDDLKKEFVDNKAYAAIIKSSNAQGGGAGSGHEGGGATGKKLSEMTATEEAIFANEHPEEYKRMIGNV